ncbi:pentapeptide repeat protein [Polaromonas naphthalenivorans CJ2]|uniref:Pentapeptide repeat protein n=2 Tax=Polaromonas naphthalenivorans TaxID=216465 RepID=A1VUP9_POLNA|nr:pentapeptide repeat protein [Polaromonas naphthalenivorans CJ2]
MMKHRLAPVLLAAAVLAASCGGGDTPSPAGGTGINTGVSPGTGSVPLYQSSTETLTLPQLRVAGNIRADVKLVLKKDGNWALLSSGPTRPATASDTPGAALAAPGGNTDLGGTQTDTTLTVARLHVGSRVFGNVAVRLTGKAWAFVSSPQEVKTLHQEDFKSNTAIRADESHHVILQSSPDSGVQNVPMQLSGRNYKFCMDAQAEGADSTTLLDAAGHTIFTLKAGEPCVTLQAREGAYTLQHRYGGTGSARTLFMRNQANTTTATALAAQAASAPPGLLNAPKLLAASATATNAMAPVAEYWSVRNPAANSGAQPRSLGNAGTFYAEPVYGLDALGTGCNGKIAFSFMNPWSAQALFRIDKNAFNVPVYMGVPLGCEFYAMELYSGTGSIPPFVYGNAIYPQYDPTLASTLWNSGLGTTYASLVKDDYLTEVDDNSLRLYPTLGLDAFVVPSHPTVTIGGVAYPAPIPMPDPNAPEGFYSMGGFFASSTLVERRQQTITEQSSTRFTLASMYSTVYSPAGVQVSSATAPVLATSDSLLTVGNAAAGDVASSLSIAYRYYPDGPPSAVLGFGQIALYTGPNCTGAVVMPQADVPTFDVSGAPALKGLGTSFKLGLQTSATAFSLPLYNGEQQHFDQLTCYSGGFGSTGWTPQSMQIAVDTVTMVISTDSCEYCNLAGVDFSGVNLTNVKLSYANLNGAILSNIDLSGADLRSVSLQGAYLINANLDGANLCAAQLNGSQGVTQAATLTGAHLRNTNLALSNLDGVKLSSASFYSSNGQGTCQQTSCSSYVASTCASAYNASLNNASFDSAYLSNVDMSNVTGAGVSFNNAALFGVLFGQANLAHNKLSSVSSSFINAYLQGTDLSRANLQFADFTGAQFDAASNCIQANLNPAYSNFPGAKVPASPGSSTCVPGKPAAAFCVQSSFAPSAGYPQTDCTNICADGSTAGVGLTNGTCPNAFTCSSASWTTPLNGGGNGAMPTSNCQGAAALCGNPFTGGADPCW